MASYHFSIKSGKKGAAVSHSQYISRKGRFAHGEKAGDLIHTSSGNMPIWAADPKEFWAAADKGERKNGAAYREHVLALPTELSPQENINLVNAYVDDVLKGKPYQFAIHNPNAAIGGGQQPHVHVMFSDRVGDEHVRGPDQYFSRHNPIYPEKGGAKKDSGGLDPAILRENVKGAREAWAKLQNEVLQEGGHASRVDHRSHRERGIKQDPERHLGQAAIRQMKHGDSLPPAPV